MVSMSHNYEPGGDVLIPEEMRERFEREARERAARKPAKLKWSAEKAFAAIALGFMAGVFCFLILAMLEKVGN
jgi:hypothetical protein